MPNQTIPYYPTKNIKEYKKKYPNGPVILELDEKYLRLSASKWGKQHLIACRVIQKVGGKILPILRTYAPKPKDLKLEEKSANIQRLIDGLEKGDLHYKSSLELEEENPELGTLWTALSECLASREAGGPNRYAQQTIRQTQGEENLLSNPATQSFEPRSPNSEDEPTPSQGSKSSSLARSSQESYKPGSSNGSEVDEDEHSDQTKSELITVNLASAFIRYVLNFCAGQKPATRWMVGFRGEPIRERNETAHIKFDATDDGGIWTTATTTLGKRPWTWGKRLALLEAKRAFHHIDLENRPVVSDANWSQYTCEALTACLNYPDEKDVFVIAMTQTSMRFLHFKRTEDYMQYLRCNNVEQQRASKAYLDMRGTDLFALDSEEGRENAVCNLLGLVRFWEEQRRQEVDRGDDDVDSSDLKGSEEGDSKEDIDDSNDKDSNPRDRKRKRY